MSLLIVVCVTRLCAFQSAAPSKFAITPDIRAALDHVSAVSLRGDLSFLASDLLEGRDTPSRGLDIAAEYIAAQFRRAGLEPGGDDGYFQTAHMAVRQPSLEGVEIRLSDGERSFTANPADVQLNTQAALDLSRAPIFKLDLKNAAVVGDLSSEQVEGKVVLTELVRGSVGNARTAFEKLRNAKPLAIMIVGRRRPSADESHVGRLIDPEIAVPGPPRVVIYGDEAAAFYASLKPGLTTTVASIRAASPGQKEVVARNVIGILRGSDPALKNTCVLLTAHYDHIGRLSDGSGDQIYNGANDDGSGTVSVIEVARALARLEQHPRRSIVFMTYFGEEEGLMGSAYYARHTVCSIQDTAAQLNLEQLGRTDSSEGPQLSNASLTGFDYSNLSDSLKEAGEITGIKVYKHTRNSDVYFSQSDNLALAQAGVPAHTLSVTFDFPDYHGLSDEWQKIDYDNMAKVDRTIALGLLMIASSEEQPHWNEANPRTAPYVKAWKERRK